MITLPGSDTKIPIEGRNYIDETGAFMDNHPAMLYQTALIKFLESIKPKERISKAKALLLFNKWHYKPIENHYNIQEYIIDNSEHGFPSAFYFGAPLIETATGEIKKWKQLVFKNDEDFHTYLSIIEQVILHQINLLKQGKLKTSVAKSPRKKQRFTLEDLFGEMALDFKKDFVDIVRSREEKVTPIKTFHEVVLYILSANQNFPRNVSAVCELFANEFGNVLGKNVESLRKGLSANNNEDLGHPTAISKVFQKYTKYHN